MQKSTLTKLIFVLFICFTNLSFASQESYLKNRLSPNDKRYETLLEALRLMKLRKAKIIVETGTARDGDKNFAGDGGSTIIFANWAKDHGAKFYSVDINQINVDCSAMFVKQYKPNVEVLCEDSLVFLKNFKQPIDFLYLDSYDFVFDDPLPSQEHHLKEIKAAFPNLHKSSVIMIDDCALPHGGKGLKAINYLKKRGWIVLVDKYQVILVHKSSNP